MKTATHTAYSPRQLAQQWGLDCRKILGWIRTGELSAFNVSRDPRDKPRWRITPQDALAFQMRRAAQPETAPTRRRRRRDNNVIEFF